MFVWTPTWAGGSWLTFEYFWQFDGIFATTIVHSYPQQWTLSMPYNSGVLVCPIIKLPE